MTTIWETCYFYVRGNDAALLNCCHGLNRFNMHKRRRVGFLLRVGVIDDKCLCMLTLTSLAAYWHDRHASYIEGDDRV